MTPRTTQVGFSQRVPLDWFERTANLVLAGNDRKTIESVLQGFWRISGRWEADPHAGIVKRQSRFS